MELFVFVIVLFSSAYGAAWSAGDYNIEDVISTLRKSYYSPVDISEHMSSSISKTHDSIQSGVLSLVCNMLTCTEWSDWSPCGSVVGRYGVQNRTRECGLNITDICREHAAGMNIDSRRCMIDIPWCPLEFEYTRGGFCVKLFNDTFLSWYDAQSHCKELNGSLINIDTRTKFDNVQESLQPMDLASIYAWVDGIKSVGGDHWKIEQGSRKPVTFGSWYHDELGDESRNVQCRCVIRHLAKEPLMWCVGNVCENRENFICEIRKPGLFARLRDI